MPEESTTTDNQPYKGLRPYEEQDQHNFFGRDAERRILIDKILANRLTLLFAASGVGKSSLLQAAVLPQLKDPRRDNLVAVYCRDWVITPLTNVKQAVLDDLVKREMLEPDAYPDDLDDASLNEFFAFCTLFTRHPLVLILDQFEEFFQYQRRRLEFKSFIQQLSAAITDRTIPIAVVISMREDFALELNAFKPALPTLLFENFYRLERLGEEQAIEAIEIPVKRFGFEYEPELLEALLEDLSSREARKLQQPVVELLDTVEPAYLQIICQQLWQFEKQEFDEGKNPDKKLRLATYHAKGDADALLKAYVDGVLNSFSASEKKLASRAFDHLISQRGTKMAFTAGYLAEELLKVDEKALSQVLETLSQRFILRRQARKNLQSGQDEYWYELYHDLFSGPIERWNSAYKAQQRNNRLLKNIGQGVLAAALIYAGYDTWVNYTHHHLRLSVKRSVSDAVELSQGKFHSADLFKQQRYLAETGYRWGELEPDKLFQNKPVAEYDALTTELIGHLPLVERIQEYLDSGHISLALKLADSAMSEDDLQRAVAIIDKLADFRSSIFSRILAKRFSIASRYLREQMVQRANRSSAFIPLLIEAIKDQSWEVRSQAAGALVQLGAERAVEPLVDLLKDQDRSVRFQAAGELGQLGAERAVEPLVDLLKDQDRSVRSQAAGALGQLGAERAVEPLLDLLKDQVRYVRSQAAGALGQLGAERAVEPLVDLLKDQSSSVRSQAAGALGQLGAERAVEPLVDLLKDQSSSVRSQAAGALGQLGAERAVEPLVDLLKDQSSSVRSQAAGALGQLGAERAVEPLVDLLKDQSSSVRSQAAGALGQLGAERAVEPLVDLLKDQSSSVRSQAAGALGQLGAERAVEPLVDLLKDQDRSVRSQAAGALGQLGAERAVEPLVDLLKDQSSSVRSQAAGALGQLGAERAVEPLVDLLKDQSSSVRSQAAGALGQLGAERAVEPLVDLLKDQSSSVRSQAAGALGQLDAERAVEPLVDLLKDQSSSVRSQAAGALGQLGAERAVEPLVDLLKDQDSYVRSQAAGALVQLGAERAVEPLLDLLKDQVSSVRSQAAGALGQLGAERAVEPLVDLLKDQDSYVRSQAAGALVQLGAERAVEPLLDLLKDQVSSVRSQAAGALGQLGAERAVEPLVDLLKDQSSSVRSQAAGALGQLGAERAVEPLLDLLKSKNKDFRRSVFIALGRINQHQVQDVILDIFNKDKRYVVQQAAALALLALGREEGVAKLYEFAQHPSANKRKILAKSLGEIPTKLGAELLLELLDDNNRSVQLQAIESVGSIKSEAAPPKLHSLLQNRNFNIRKAAVEAIVAMAAANSVPVLREQLLNTEGSLPLRMLALQGLTAIGTDEAINHVLDVLQQDKAEETFGGRTYRLLGDAKPELVLDPLKDRLEKLGTQYRKWRSLRDEYRATFTEEQENNWLERTNAVRPNPRIALPLGFALAKLDPDDTGFELLSHDLADVRHGAWLGLAKVASVERLKKLFEKRKKSDYPIFKHAAYRAIDHMLIRLETYGSAEDLAKLQAWYPEIKAVEGVGTRTEWTIEKLMRLHP